MSSSSIEYPTASSPRIYESPRKRRRLGTPSDRSPLKTLQGNVVNNRPTIGGFLDDQDSDNEQTSLPFQASHKPVSTELQQYSTRSEDDLVPGFVEDGNHIRNDSGCDVLSSPPKARPEPPLEDTFRLRSARSLFTARTASGRNITITRRRKAQTLHYSELIAARSTAVPGCAQKNYYGVEVHALLDQSKALLGAPHPNPSEAPAVSIESGLSDIAVNKKSSRTLLWTEKYRARKFTDLIGDERTHRSVLRWLKGWDPIVFPSQYSSRPKARNIPNDNDNAGGPDRPHRKILLLTGPPGLGKTTLAHVCAKQAGYETQEINASDERTKDVVKNRVRDLISTENVRSVDQGSNGNKRVVKPVCVVVDEVDGVVSGSGAGAGAGGDGGFIKALTELLALDHKNANRNPVQSTTRKKKGDEFRMLRPLILICNDIYHPSLRLLRHGTMAEVVHVRKPALQMIVPRLCAIFEKEGVPADGDGVRTLCEAAWGVTSRKQGGKRNGVGTSEGDIRGILVTGEWVAGKLRAAASAGPDITVKLTRQWIEQNIIGELAHGGGMAKSLGRGSVRDIVERVFKHNAGFSDTATTVGSAGHKRSRADIYGHEAAISVSEASKRNAMQRLREMVEANGEEEKVMLDCFTLYPTRSYNDTAQLAKPDSASDWLYFSSLCSHRVHMQQEWDLAQYLPFATLAFHSLFASSNNALVEAKNTVNTNEPESESPKHALHTQRADAQSFEMHRANSAHLSQLHSDLSLPLQRSFRGNSMTTELVPYALRMLNPAVKPVLVGGTSSVRRGEERELISRSVQCMLATGIKFEKGKVDFAGTAEVEQAIVDRGPAAVQANAGWVYRMEPPLDELGTYGTFEAIVSSWEGDAGKARYALRQVLSQTLELEVKKAEGEARRRRTGASHTVDVEKSLQRDQIDAGEEARRKAKAAIKRDFFGRPISATTASGDAVALSDRPGSAGRGQKGSGDLNGKPRVWATYHEGYSNAVRKHITMQQLLEGL